MSKIIHRGTGEEMTLIALYTEIWLRSNKKSFISDVFLRDLYESPYRLNLFAHILPKAQNKYPYFKFYAKNIKLLTPTEHHYYDNGTEEQRINFAMDVEEKSKWKVKVNWQRLKDLEIELKAEYKKHFPTTFMGIINYKYSPEEIHAKISKLNKGYWESIKNNK